MRRLTSPLLGSFLAAVVLLGACAPSAPAPAVSPAPPPAAASVPSSAAASAPAAPVPATAAPAALMPVRMGTQTSVNDIAMWLGAERGYFREEGVDLDL